MLQFGNYVYRFNDSDTSNQHQPYLLDDGHWHHLYIIYSYLFHWWWNDTVSARRRRQIANHTYPKGSLYQLSPLFFGATNTKNSFSIHFHFRTKEKSIYRLLDWRKPGKAIVVSLGCIFCVVIVHLLVYCLYRFRVCIFEKFCMRERTFHRYAVNDDQIIIQNNQTLAKQVARTPSSYDESKSEQFFNPSTVVELKWAGRSCCSGQHSHTKIKWYHC